MPLVQNPDGPVRSSKPKSTKKPNTSGSFGIEGAGTIGNNGGYTPPPKQNRPSVTPANKSYSSGGGGGYSGGGYTGGQLSATPMGTVAEVAPVEPPKPPSDADWWSDDSAYQSESGSLKTALDTALADLVNQRTSYDADFMTTLKNLGWSWGDNTKIDGFEKGAWDPTNQLGAYGAGQTNLNNDFASRGLFDSSFFADALTNFNTDMNNQYQGLVGNRTNFMDARKDDETAANDEYTNALARAKAESLARRDAQYGVV